MIVAVVLLFCLVNVNAQLDEAQACSVLCGQFIDDSDDYYVYYDPQGRGWWSDAWNKVKKTASSGWNKVKNAWKKTNNHVPYDCLIPAFALGRGCLNFINTPPVLSGPAMSYAKTPGFFNENKVNAIIGPAISAVGSKVSG